MAPRFSKQELRELRNRIPIRYLIEKELNLPNRIDGKIFRFECPICGSFHSSVKKETNLARCFDCSENFNTIDMVKKARSVEFYESAAFLRKVLELGKFNPVSDYGDRNHHAGDKRDRRSSRPTAGGEPYPRSKAVGAKMKKPCSIGSILEKTQIVSQAVKKTGKKPGNKNGDVSISHEGDKVYPRIEKLENQVRDLKYHLDQLKKFTIDTVVGELRQKRYR